MTKPGPFQSTRIKVVDKTGADARLAFSAHIPDRKQDLLAIPAHPYSRENRDVGGIAVQSGLDHSAVKDQPNDGPHPRGHGCTRRPNRPSHLRHARLTTSLLTADPGRARTARVSPADVLVPDRYTEAISASAFLVSRWYARLAPANAILRRPIRLPQRSAHAARSPSRSTNVPVSMPLPVRRSDTRLHEARSSRPWIGSSPRN